MHLARTFSFTCSPAPDDAFAGVASFARGDLALADGAPCLFFAFGRPGHPWRAMVLPLAGGRQLDAQQFRQAMGYPLTEEQDIAAVGRLCLMALLGADWPRTDLEEEILRTYGRAWLAAVPHGVLPRPDGSVVADADLREAGT